MSKGSLTIVGTGIQLGQMTIITKSYIENAEKVLYLVADVVTAKRVEMLNGTAESMHHFYKDGKERIHTYNAMSEHMLSFVRQGLKVCAVFYGHPGVFVTPTHQAIKQARAEGYSATMLAAVSADACLFADLGLDPSADGCQSFEATNFLVRKRIHDPNSALILWQVGLIGVFDRLYDLNTHNAVGIRVLTEVLAETYGLNHEVIIYEASEYPIYEARAQRIPLSELPTVELSSASTLYVPAKAKSKLDPEMMRRLGLRD